MQRQRIKPAEFTIYLGIMLSNTLTNVDILLSRHYVINALWTRRSEKLGIFLRHTDIGIYKIGIYELGIYELGIYEQGIYELG